MNIINNDPYCYLWLDSSALYPVESNPNRKSSHSHFSEILKYDDIKFPISLTHVLKFEKMNNLRINIYSADREENDKKGVIFRFYISRKASNILKIHFLMIENSEIVIYSEDYFNNNEIGINNSVYQFA